MRLAATRWARSSRSPADHVAQSPRTEIKVAVSPTATVTVMASSKTVTAGMVRGRRNVGISHTAIALASTATVSDDHPGACCHNAHATMAVQVASTQPTGHESTRAARGPVNMAPQYPAYPRMAKGRVSFGYL